MKELTNETRSEIIVVDRSFVPEYYPGEIKIIYPKLQKSGPDQIQLFEIKRFWAESYQTRRLHHVYSQIKERGLIPSALNLQDMEAIRNKGIDFFNKIFYENDIILFWKSIIISYGENGTNRLMVPALGRKGCMRGTFNEFRIGWFDCVEQSYSWDLISLYL